MTNSDIPIPPLPIKRTFEIPLATLASAVAIMTGNDLTRISPIELAELSNDLYKSGVIEFDDFVVISFQEELNPEQYLIKHGKYPRPLFPKNAIRECYDKLEIALRQSASATRIEKLERAIDLLETLQFLSIEPLEE